MDLIAYLQKAHNIVPRDPEAVPVQWSEASLPAPLRDRLMTRERVRWVGQPDRKVHFTALDWFIVPFGLAWIVGPLSGLLDTLRSGDKEFIPLVFPFLLFGFYFLIGHFIYKYLRRRGTYYAVTDERVLILSTFLRPEMIVFYDDTLPLLDASYDKAGNGTVRFGDSFSAHAQFEETGMEIFASLRGDGWGMPLVPPAFYNIPDARQVVALLNGMRRSAIEREDGETADTIKILISYIGKSKTKHVYYLFINFSALISIGKYTGDSPWARVLVNRIFIR